MTSLFWLDVLKGAGTGFVCIVIVAVGGLPLLFEAIMAVLSSMGDDE